LSLLVVEDDDEMRESLAEQLAIVGGFAVTVAASFAEAEACASRPGARFDAFLLDVSLPDGDGRDLCAWLRQRGITAPVIMLTAWNETVDVVRGLQAGANDYVAKPFRLLELLARLRAHLRGHQSAGDAVFTVGNYLFRPAAKRLERLDRGQHIFLTSKEVAILRLLCRAGGRTVTKYTLFREVWGYGPGIDTHTLETHVYRLRRKIETDPRLTRILVNVRGGYRLDTAERPAAGRRGTQSGRGCGDQASSEAR
jgi:DNA-binding response OmpR family regulator